MHTWPALVPTSLYPSVCHVCLYKNQVAFSLKLSLRKEGIPLYLCLYSVFHNIWPIQFFIIILNYLEIGSTYAQGESSKGVRGHSVKI